MVLPKTFPEGGAERRPPVPQSRPGCASFQRGLLHQGLLVPAGFSRIDGLTRSLQSGRMEQLEPLPEKMSHLFLQR